jgi:hypothetical protein
MLPDPFKYWLQGRIMWLEKVVVPTDLARLRNVISKNTSDGFPVDDEDTQ